MGRTQVICQALPGLMAKRLRHLDRVDAQQRNSAQDKGHNSSFKLDSAGITNRCDVAPRLDRPGQPAQCLAADIVNSAAPQALLQRSGTHLKFMAVNKVCCAELFQIIMLV